ncbi:MAG: COX15/CtaA family protein [Rhodocyclaceae bacterium]|nr:COX15/CtaA family protein [Rhodocyclaceae bacterium]
MKALRRMILAALGLTLVVVVFGAYVRLSDAGLGCPDWPGCYGHPTPAHAASQIREAEALQPGGPVSAPKAWKEMIHRYLAASLGLLIIAIAIQSWRKRREPGSAPVVATSLVGVVVFQGLLGKWTVTLLLKPAIVTGHLLGGLTTLGLLVWLALRVCQRERHVVPTGLLAATRLGLLLLAVQIALGGWTSTNYAALACQDLPRCHGSWLPETDFANAFHVVRELGMDADGGLLSQQALTAIHWTHRVGALVAGSYLLLLAGLLARHRAVRGHAVVLTLALGLQLGLGVANVLLSLPLPLAVAHNAGAALLLLVLVAINHTLVRDPALRPVRGSSNANAYA